MHNGVALKFNEPSEARKPTTRWRLYTFKGNEMIGGPSHMGDTVILTDTGSNGSEITVWIPRQWPPMSANGGVE
jgi:hypothetical protein